MSSPFHNFQHRTPFLQLIARKRLKTQLRRQAYNIRRSEYQCLYRLLYFIPGCYVLLFTSGFALLFKSMLRSALSELILSLLSWNILLIVTFIFNFCASQANRIIHKDMGMCSLAFSNLTYANGTFSP